ncbi:MAG: RecX family transcriptional regulator [Bdellovibrionaceae bacterium]|nr:RecX family transcriptional regulator [Pseudobdellovibrionaceae bacterium]
MCLTQHPVLEIQERSTQPSLAFFQWPAISKFMEWDIERDENYEKAISKIADYVSRRDHSERELRDKLLRKFDSELVEQVIARAHELDWIPSPEALAKKVAAELDRKNKGYLYIQNYLRQKGLPSVPSDSQVELQKATDLVERKFGELPIEDHQARQKAWQFLASRGFLSETVREILG